MADLRWTPQALEDIAAIAAYIARDAPRTAKRFARKLYETPESLRRFPKSGQIVPELQREDIREIRLKRYRIVYRVLNTDTLEILTVFHGSRLLDTEIFEIDDGPIHDNPVEIDLGDPDDGRE